jgi:hypothetical protein
LSPIHEEGHDATVSLKASANFSPNEVAVIMEARLLSLLPWIEPLPPDQNQNRVALSDLGLNLGFEMLAWADRVHVEENIPFAEQEAKTIVETPGGRSRIVAAVIDKDFLGH